MIMLRSTVLRVPRVGIRAAYPAPSILNRSIISRYYSNKLTDNSPVTEYSSSKPIVKYTPEHEWVALHDDGTAFLGITKYAADALGDCTYVEVSDDGEEVEAGDSIGSVESVKSASDIYSPVTGEIIKGNTDLLENAAIINQDPLGKGWIAQIKVSTPSQVESLLDLEAYEEFIKSDEH